MPKIEVNESLFFNMLGAELEAKLGAKQNYDKLEEILTSAKAELDEKPDTSLPEKERIIKIELNDTNRPDLWSTAGLASFYASMREENQIQKAIRAFFHQKKKLKTLPSVWLRPRPNLKKSAPLRQAL